MVTNGHPGALGGAQAILSSVKDRMGIATNSHKFLFSSVGTAVFKGRGFRRNKCPECGMCGCTRSKLCGSSTARDFTVFRLRSTRPLDPSPAKRSDAGSLLKIVLNRHSEVRYSPRPVEKKLNFGTSGGTGGPS